MSYVAAGLQFAARGAGEDEWEVAVGVPIAAYIRGTFRCSANGGTLALAMGNNVSGAGAGSAITVLAGSYGYVWRMV